MNYGWENDDSELVEGDDMFNGDSVTMQYLKTKMLFSFPTGEAGIKEPMRVQVIWGFITRPFMFTPYSTPAVGNVTVEQLKDLAKNQVEEYWNSKQDQLTFRKKQNENIRVIGKRWIRPDRTARIGVPQTPVTNASTGGSMVGAPPDVRLDLSWPVKGQRWELTYTNATGDTGDYGAAAASPQFFNNESWIPFFVVYSPDYDSVTPAGTPGHPVPEANRIQLSYSTACWYKDA